MRFGGRYVYTPSLHVWYIPVSQYRDDTGTCIVPFRYKCGMAGGGIEEYCINMYRSSTGTEYGTSMYGGNLSIHFYCVALQILVYYK